MVLNHASVFAEGQRRDDVTRWLADLAQGIGGLVGEGVVSGELRMTKELHSIDCSVGWSLYDAILGMRSDHREEYQILARLATKSPLLRDLPAAVNARFHGCEGVSISPGEGAPLLLCAIGGGLAVGLPTAPGWDQDSIVVEFMELLPNATIEAAEESVDNLTRSRHAVPISQRHRQRLVQRSDPASLWNDRKQCFPALEFGPGVEQDLVSSATHFETIARRLADIDRAAADWKVHGGPAPKWPTKVTDESALEPKNLRRRRFPSYRGAQVLFTWHARYGSGGRIHLRLDPAAREVEIGYIGPHLPLYLG